jgi:hypothetical protein
LTGGDGEDDFVGAKNFIEVILIDFIPLLFSLLLVWQIHKSSSLSLSLLLSHFSLLFTTLPPSFACILSNICLYSLIQRYYVCFTSSYTAPLSLTDDIRAELLLLNKQVYLRIYLHFAHFSYHSILIFFPPSNATRGEIFHNNIWNG